MRTGLIVTALLAVAPLGAAAAAVPAPLQRAPYVVVLEQGAPLAPLLSALDGLGARRTATWTAGVRGAAVRLSPSVASVVRALPGVAAVEPDALVRATAVQRRPPSYGLDRVDQRGLPLSGSFATRTDGRGVTAYVVDTGVRRDHVDLAGRVAAGYDRVDGGRPDDCNGHGTHVAGTLAGTAHGVAKGARVVPVRVLDCEGSGATSAVISGLDDVVRDHRAGTPAVANLSLSGSASTALDRAVQAVIADGVTVVVAGGNDGGFLADTLGGSDACGSSPGRVRGALTVGATDRTDTRASYSDIGRCLDLFAPGSEITSAWFTSRTATAVLSGTSMAAPHVAGAAALLLQAEPGRTPAQVAQRLVTEATPRAVRGAGAGSPDRLLFVR